MKNFLVASYVRLSNDDGSKDESNSITSQKEYIGQYIKNNNMKLVKTYVDDGYTGTNFDRPQFKKMIEDIENGIINCIIVKDLSRFGRDYIGVGKYLEKFFPEYNIRFISINDSYDSFNNRDNDDLVIPIKNIFNANYSKDISKKVKTAFKAKQASGDFIGAFACYGYIKSPTDKHKLIIDESASKIVAMIYKMFISGMGKIRIAKELNLKGIPCPTEYKKLNGMNYYNSKKITQTTYWTYSTIHKILSNEMYIGNMVQNKTVRITMHGKAHQLDKDQWIIVKNTHPAIIDEETWNTTKVLLAKRGREIEGFSKGLSLFAGFIVCGDCGRSLVKRNISKQNKTNYYYICSSYVNYGTSMCTRKTISLNVLKKAVLDKLNKELAKIDLSKIKNSSETKNMKKKSMDIETSKLKDRLKTIQNRKKKLFESYADDIITLEEYEKYKEDYAKEETQINSQINFISEDFQYNEEEDDWVNMLIKYKGIKELNREILANILEKIIVTETKKEIKLEIRFKYKLS